MTPAILTALALTLAAALPAVAQTRAVPDRPSEGRWVSGIVEVTVRAEVANRCIRFAGARPLGASGGTLDVRVTFQQARGPNCGTEQSRIERTFNFASIARGVNVVSLSFHYEGREVGRETVPLGIRRR